MHPLKVKTRKLCCTPFSNVTQDSLSLALTCGLTFGNRSAQMHPVLSMTYPQKRIYSPVTSKTDGTAKHLLVTTGGQAGIHMNTSQTHDCYQDK